MYIAATGLVLLTISLMILIGFRYRSDVSRFELKRRSLHSREYKDQWRFQQIYPGIRVLCAALGLVVAVAICSLAYAQWQFGGALIAIAAIVLALLLSRTLKNVSQELIDKHLAWFNKYFAWTEILGRISLNVNEPQIQSRQELMHVIEKSDFMDEADRNMVVSAMNFSEIKLSDIMVSRNKIISINHNDTIGPKLIDELHSSGHKIFPVVDGDIDNIVGTLYLDDITIVDRNIKSLEEAIRPSLPSVNRAQSLSVVLNQMAKLDTPIMMVIDDKGKVVGLVSLGDIVRVLIKN